MGGGGGNIGGGGGNMGGGGGNMGGGGGASTCGPQTCGGCCSNGVCQNASCRPAHCGNGTKDVDESDKDCGGLCKKCGLGANCNRDSDCGSDNCLFGNTYCGP